MATTTHSVESASQPTRGTGTSAMRCGDAELAMARTQSAESLWALGGTWQFRSRTLASAIDMTRYGFIRSDVGVVVDTGRDGLQPFSQIGRISSRD